MDHRHLYFYQRISRKMAGVPQENIIHHTHAPKGMGGQSKLGKGCAFSFLCCYHSSHAPLCMWDIVLLCLWFKKPSIGPIFLHNIVPALPVGKRAPNFTLERTVWILTTSIAAVEIVYWTPFCAHCHSQSDTKQWKSPESDSPPPPNNYLNTKQLSGLFFSFFNKWEC